MMSTKRSSHQEFETRADADAEYPGADFAHEPFAVALWSHLIWNTALDHLPSASESQQFRRAMTREGRAVTSVKLPISEAGNSRGTRFQILWSLRDLTAFCRPVSRTWTAQDSLAEYLDQHRSDDD